MVGKHLYDKVELKKSFTGSIAFGVVLYSVFPEGRICSKSLYLHHFPCAKGLVL